MMIKKSGIWHKVCANFRKVLESSVYDNARFLGLFEFKVRKHQKATMLKQLIKGTFAKLITRRSSVQV